MVYATKHLPEPSKLMTIEARAQITKIIMKLLDEWALPTSTQLNLLGLRETSRNMLTRYHKLDSIIPYDQDKLERIGILLAIYKNLYDLYPENKELRHHWLISKNTLLDNQRPIDIMTEKGLFGMAHIMRFLDLQMVQ